MGKGVYSGFCFPESPGKEPLDQVKGWQEAASKFHACIHEKKFPVFNITEYNELKKMNESRTF